MANDILILIFQLIVLIFSVMVHEVSHGLVAYKLGDNTAKRMGRLNLNPKNHLDPVGSIFIPLFLFLMTGGRFVLGWAKPVPYNPENLRNPKMGAALIGAAGPLSNLLLAVIFGSLIRLAGIFSQPILLPLILFFDIIVYINLLLAIFNLVPIPPLDGSKLFFALLPARHRRVQAFLEQYGMALLLFFIFFGFGLIIPIIGFLHRWLVGPFALL